MFLLFLLGNFTVNKSIIMFIHQSDKLIELLKTKYPELSIKDCIELLLKEEQVRLLGEINDSVSDLRDSLKIVSGEEKNDDGLPKGEL